MGLNTINKEPVDNAVDKLTFKAEELGKYIHSNEYQASKEEAEKAGKRVEIPKELLPSVEDYNNALAELNTLRTGLNEQEQSALATYCEKINGYKTNLEDAIIDHGNNPEVFNWVLDTFTGASDLINKKKMEILNDESEIEELHDADKIAKLNAATSVLNQTKDISETSMGATEAYAQKVTKENSFLGKLKNKFFGKKETSSENKITQEAIINTNTPREQVEEWEKPLNITHREANTEEQKRFDEALDKDIVNATAIFVQKGMEGISPDEYFIFGSGAQMVNTGNMKAVHDVDGQIWNLSAFNKMLTNFDKYGIKYEEPKTVHGLGESKMVTLFINGIEIEMFYPAEGAGVIDRNLKGEMIDVNHKFKDQEGKDQDIVIPYAGVELSKTQAAVNLLQDFQNGGITAIAAKLKELDARPEDVTEDLMETVFKNKFVKRVVDIANAMRLLLLGGVIDFLKKTIQIHKQFKLKPEKQALFDNAGPTIQALELKNKEILLKQENAKNKKEEMNITEDEATKNAMLLEGFSIISKETKTMSLELGGIYNDIEAAGNEEDLNAAVVRIEKEILDIRDENSKTNFQKLFQALETSGLQNNDELECCLNMMELVNRHITPALQKASVKIDKMRNNGQISATITDAEVKIWELNELTIPMQVQSQLNASGALQIPTAISQVDYKYDLPT